MDTSTILNIIGNDFISHFTTNYWGDEILIMEKSGKAFSRIYWYYDEKDVIYLDMLSVDKDSRKQGLGRKLQEIREKIGIELGATISYLFVNKTSWMYSWYKRRGYVEYADKEENMVWMEKHLI